MTIEGYPRRPQFGSNRPCVISPIGLYPPGKTAFFFIFSHLFPKENHFKGLKCIKLKPVGALSNAREIILI